MTGRASQGALAAFKPGTSLVALILLTASPAFAHSPMPGLEGFYTGLAHALQSPPAILALLALSILYGRIWPRSFVRAWALLALTFAAGLWAGPITADGLWPGAGASLNVDIALYLTAVAAAVLAALLPERLIPAILPLMVLAGFLAGLRSSPDEGPLDATLPTAGGALCGSCLVLLYGAGGVGWLFERWPSAVIETGGRILAAWIAAIAGLMAALESVA